jgi:putative FmdB family regulatory protein
MPKYDFRCPSCGLEFEVRRPLSQAGEPAACPNDGAAAQRVFTMPLTFVKGGTVGASGPEVEASAAGGSTSGQDHGHGHGHDHGHTHGPGGHTH